MCIQMGPMGTVYCQFWPVDFTTSFRLTVFDKFMSYDKYHLNWSIRFAINDVDKRRRSKFSGVFFSTGWQGGTSGKIHPHHSVIRRAGFMLLITATSAHRSGRAMIRQVV